MVTKVTNLLSFHQDFTNSRKPVQLEYQVQATKHKSVFETYLQQELKELEKTQGNK